MKPVALRALAAFDQKEEEEEYVGRSSTAWTAAKQVGESCTEFVQRLYKWVHGYFFVHHGRQVP